MAFNDACVIDYGEEELSMIAITFDTLKHVKILKAAGFTDQQAEGLSEAQALVFEKSFEDIATKRDLRELEVRLDAKLEKELSPIRVELAKIHGELATLRWGMAVIVGGVVALLLRSFFP
ncbi:MAG: DUF1640 domain-containing protein [Magnetococcales bacterium]|nr:DUF1640 domain-containing protein [Magnetococcales bacterium]